MRLVAHMTRKVITSVADLEERESQVLRDSIGARDARFGEGDEVEKLDFIFYFFWKMEEKLDFKGRVSCSKNILFNKF